MNGNGGYRPRNPSDGPGSGGRYPPNPGRGPGGTASPPLATSAPINRAERFEDEKRRIIESCFSKKDAEQHILESYITHVRVEEDAAYPQTPPPPDSPPGNKKPRVIIVSVKNTGRVRMHKARENANRSFSIGKTWNLEELTGLESFTNLKPQSPEEAQHKEWAGDIGFIVTMAKPYYWQAGTAKEKEFFIASVVKIFKKYTGGKVPDLKGFSQLEIDSMLGLVATPGNLPPPAPRPGQRPPGSSTSPGRPPPVSRLSPEVNAIPSRNRPPTSGEDRPPPQRPPSRGQPMIPPQFQSRDPSRQPRSQEPGVRQVPSRGQLRGPPSQSPGFDNRLTPQSSRSDFANNKSLTPDGSSISSREGSAPPLRSPDPPRGRQLDAPSTTEAPSDIPSKSSTPVNVPVVGRDAEIKDDRFRQAPPERKRPPITGPLGIGYQGSPPVEARERPPAPLASPGRPSDQRPPTSSRSQESLQELPSGPAPGSQAPDTGTQARAKSPPEPEKAPAPVDEPPAAEPEAQMEPPEASSLQTTPIEIEEFRPGLGPMVKKKVNAEVANTLRKAANAYNAFKPRAGGAAERFKASQKQNLDEPDGITGVVPAPRKVQTPVADSPIAETPTMYERQELPKPSVSTDNIPEVTISSPQSATPKEFSQPTPPLAPPQPQTPPTEEAKKIEVPEVRRQKRRSIQHAQYLSRLGVDPSILEGRGLDFESALVDFGWGESASQTQKLEAIEADIRRELGRVEAGSWLGHLDQKDERVETVEKLLDKAIAECEELEGLLTLYNVELSSLNDDIAFIEAQSQGLQVQTANQKLLQNELQTLVETITITAPQLAALKQASIGKPDGLEDIENALVLLFKALSTIDPSLRHANRPANDRSKRMSTMGNNELSNMKALIDKREMYMAEAAIFLGRLGQHLDITFGAALMLTKDELERQKGGSLAMVSTKLDVRAHDIARTDLWQYSALLLFAKEIDQTSWENYIKMYQQRARPIYQDEFRDNVFAWKRQARKYSGEEHEALFTTQEKENESIATTARKLTVKRSQTLARGLRNASGGEKSPVDKQAGKLFPYEIFAGALEEATPLIFTEQNFVVDFFHATSAGNTDFADIVSATPPKERRGTNLFERKLYDPDRAMARKVTEIMEELFAFWPSDMQSLLEWAVKQDPLQGVGILCALYRKLSELEDTNQDFIATTIQKLSERLSGLFTRFVDEQIRAIEDTKVKIKKRRGVIAFVKTFPLFSSTIESMFPSENEDILARSEVRNMVDGAYARINKAMFESLKVIAKESPMLMAKEGMGDPEDKEALNYHILLIENMNHYVEEVEDKGDGVLAEWRRRASEEMTEHMGLYVDAVIRRPLGKLLEFVESTESLLASLASGTPPSSLSSRSSHSRSVFKKLLSSHDAKEIRKGVDLLKKRVDKHFGEGDDTALSRNLVAKVLKECQTRYDDVWERTLRVGKDVYENSEGGAIEWDVRKEDVAAAFRK